MPAPMSPRPRPTPNHCPVLRRARGRGKCLHPSSSGIRDPWPQIIDGWNSRKPSPPSTPFIPRLPRLPWQEGGGAVPLGTCFCSRKDAAGGEVGRGWAGFRPAPGDIIILRNERRARFPQYSAGFVALYLDDLFFERTVVQDRRTLDKKYTHDFVKGDIVVRMGSFDQNWRWRRGEVVQVFICESKHFWWLAATVGGRPLQPPVYRDVEAPQLAVSSPDLYFKPRHGDFIIRGLPGIDNLKKWDALWWHPRLEMKPFDMLLRAGYGVAREFGNHNVTKVAVEMYWLYDTLRYWIFVGRDAYTYASQKRSLKNYAYTVPVPRVDVSSGWQHVQDVLRKKSNKTFFRKQKPGKQRRVLDQAYDHHLPAAFDHLGFDDLERQ